MSKARILKISIAASAGGHLTELLRLSDCWMGYEICSLTTGDFAIAALIGYGDVSIVGECNRLQPMRVVKVFLQCIKVVLKERPDVVISTGAAAGCMLCFLGKMRGAKVIWIDSITNVERISLSGRMVRYIADLFLVQWPELASRYKRVEYVGSVI